MKGLNRVRNSESDIEGHAEASARIETIVQTLKDTPGDDMGKAVWAAIDQAGERYYATDGGAV